MFLYKSSHLTPDQLTPREQLSKAKRISRLAKFQYENGLSIDEMDKEFERQKVENTEKNAPITTVVYDSIDFNHAYYMLKTLFQQNNKKKKR